jgi:hypothetical protein
MTTSAGEATRPRRWRSWRRTLLRWFVLLAIIYVILILVLVALEDFLVYPAGVGGGPIPPPAGLVVEEVYMRLEDGRRIHAWWCSLPDSRATILYCHGNAGDLTHRGGVILDLQQRLQASVLIFDYPGYGQSDGTPTEKGCYAAGDAAYDWLVTAQRIPAERIVLLGVSLGGGVATDLATRRPHRALVLCKTFTSMPDVGRGMFPFVPTHWLMRNRFDNLGKISRCTRPIFITHGTDDGTIPDSHAERLFAAAPGPRQLYLMEGVGHNAPIFTVECLLELRGFLAGH